MPSSTAAGEAIRNRVVLERACVQFSGPISHIAPQDAFREAENFLGEFAKDYPYACARALVYRVECSDEGDDRLAAWLLLDHALRLGIKEQKRLRDEEKLRRRDPDHPATTIVDDLRATVKFNVLVDAIGELLPKLIRHRWDETAPVAVGTSNAAVDGQHKQRQPSYEAMRVSWTRAFVNPLLSEVRQACEDVRKPTGPQESKDITPPWFLVDACWKLRRERPRPSSAAYVRRLFFEASPVPDAAVMELQTITDGRNHTAAPRSSVYHSRVMAWMAFAEAHKANVCERSDVWTSSMPSVDHLGHAPSANTVDARRILSRFIREDTEVSAPTFAARILDEGCSMLQNERSCELLLASFDQLRGGVTSASSRAALELLASYRVMPSWLIDFEKARRDIVCDVPTMILRETASMGRFMSELEGKQHRLREGRAVRAAVRVLALEFAALISDDLYFELTRIRNNNEFVFAAVGLESFPGQFQSLGAGPGGKKKGGKKPRSPEDEAKAAQDAADAAIDAAEKLVYKPERLRQNLAEHDDLIRFKSEIDVLCRHCLGAGHSSQKCPKAYELGYYDLNVAKAVIGISPDRKWIESEPIQARLSTKSTEPADLRFRFAVYVLAGEKLDGIVPYCTYCAKENKVGLGHTRDNCKHAIESVIEKRFQTGSVMLRLMPHLAQETLNRERDVLKRREAEVKATEKRGEDADIVEKKRVFMKLKDRDVNDMVDALKWLRTQEPRVAPSVHKNLEAIDEATRSLANLVPVEVRRSIPHVSLLPAIGLLDPDAIQEMLDVTGNSDVTARRVFGDASFPSDEAWVLAITRHAFDEDGSGPSTDANQLVAEIHSSCVTELRRDIPLSDLATQRTQIARHAWERRRTGYDAVASGLTLESALDQLRSVVDEVRQKADGLKQAAALARKSASDATRRQDWSTLSKPSGPNAYTFKSMPALSQTASGALRPPSATADDSLFEAQPVGMALGVGSEFNSTVKSGSRVPGPPVPSGGASSMHASSHGAGNSSHHASSHGGGSSHHASSHAASSHGGRSSHNIPPPPTGSSIPLPPTRTPGPPVSVVSGVSGHSGAGTDHRRIPPPPSVTQLSLSHPPSKYHRSEHGSSHASSHHAGSAFNDAATSVAGASEIPPPPTGMPAPPVPAVQQHLVPPPLSVVSAGTASVVPPPPTTQTGVPPPPTPPSQ